MTPEKAVQELNELAACDDPEYAHSEGDKILMSFVPPEVREAYDQIEPKWYA